VVTVSFEFNRVTRLDFNACDRSHLHHAAFHAHFVELETVGSVRLPTEESFESIAVVHESYIRRRPVRGVARIQGPEIFKLPTVICSACDGLQRNRIGQQ